MPTALHKEMNTKHEGFAVPISPVYTNLLFPIYIRRDSLGRPSVAMAEMLRSLWGRAQGKWHVRRICNKIFNDYSDKEKRCLSLDDLHVAVLRVYNSVNQQFLSPHKEPPSVIDVADKIQAYRAKGIEAINREEFYLLIMEWIRKDLHLVLANKVLAASLAAPALAVITKNAGRQVPRIKDVSEKIPTPLLFSVYFIGLVLL